MWPIFSHNKAGALSTVKDLFDGIIVAHQFGKENTQGLVNKPFKGVSIIEDKGSQ